MQTINTQCHGIIVTLDGQGGGSIESDLHEDVETETATGSVAETLILDAAVDALESLVLAHAVAGIDITSPAYLEGLETAIDAVFNRGAQ